MRVNLNNSLDRWIFDSIRATPKGLGLFRIFTGLMFLFFFIPSKVLFELFVSLPADFFNPPPGPMMLFDGYPPLIVFEGLYLVLYISAAAMFLGFFTRWSSLLTGLTILTLNGFIYSIGKINHEILLAVVPILFSFSNWGAAYSLDQWLLQKKQTVNSWPFPLLGLILGFMMFTAGFPKLMGGWLDPSTQAAQGHFLNQFFQKGRADLLAEYAIHWDHVLFWEFLDYATVLFEIGFLLAIFHPVSMRIFVCLAVLFHFSTMMVMNIAYLFNFTAYAAFLNWAWVNQKLTLLTNKVASNSMGRHFTGFAWGLLLALVFIFMRFLDSQGYFVSESDLRTHEVVLLSLFMIVSVIGLSVELRKGLNRLNRGRAGKT